MSMWSGLDSARATASSFSFGTAGSTAYLRRAGHMTRDTDDADAIAREAHCVAFCEVTLTYGIIRLL